MSHALLMKYFGCRSGVVGILEFLFLYLIAIWSFITVFVFFFFVVFDGRMFFDICLRVWIPNDTEQRDHSVWLEKHV